MQGSSSTCSMFFAMPLDTQRFVRLRPMLYHLTAASNAEQIRASQTLLPASVLYRQAGMGSSVRNRRRSAEWIECDGCRVHIRDQAPLHRGSVWLSDGWDFEDLVEHLNDNVFFWPGTANRPIAHGHRHFKRYSADDVVVLAIDTQALFASNSTLPPRFCRYNSGSPRCSGGRGSPRGPRTFLAAEEFHQRPSDVVEVTFRGAVRLDDCEVVTQSVGALLRD